MQHQELRPELVQDLAQVLQVRVQREGDLEGGAGLVEVALAQADLAEARHGAEMARLQFEGPADIGEALDVAVLDEGERRALVPGLRPVRMAPDEMVEERAPGRGRGTPSPRGRRPSSPRPAGPRARSTRPRSGPRSRLRAAPARGPGVRGTAGSAGAAGSRPAGAARGRARGGEPGRSRPRRGWKARRSCDRDDATEDRPATPPFGGEGPPAGVPGLVKTVPLG